MPISKAMILKYLFLKKQFDLGLHCLSRLFWLAAIVSNFAWDFRITCTCMLYFLSRRFLS